MGGPFCDCKIEDSPGSRVFRLSAAYDMLPVNVILPTDKEEMALTIRGRKRKLHKKDFLVLAGHFGIPGKAAQNLINTVLRKKEKFIQICRYSQLSEAQKEQVLQLMEERMTALE